MALYHFSASVIGIGKGKKSALSAASYRSGERLRDDIQQKSYFYNREDDISDSYILLPEEAKEKYKNREYLWNEVQKKELVKKGDRYKKSAVFAREYNISLQQELSLSQNKEVLNEFVQKNFTDRGFPADVAIHNSDTSNPHAHIMIPTRTLNEEGFSKNKDRTFEPRNGKESVLQEMREDWSKRVNEKFKNHDIKEEITHLSYKEQGIDKEPQLKVPHRRKVTEDYIQTQKFNELIEKDNKVRQKLYKEKKEVKNNLSYYRKEEMKLAIKSKSNSNKKENEKKTTKAMLVKKENLNKKQASSKADMKKARKDFVAARKESPKKRFMMKQKYKAQRLATRMVKKSLIKATLMVKSVAQKTAGKAMDFSKQVVKDASSEDERER